MKQTQKLRGGLIFHCGTLFRLRNETDKSQRVNWLSPRSIMIFKLKRAIVEFRKGCRWTIGRFCSGKNVFSKRSTVIDLLLFADYFPFL